MAKDKTMKKAFTLIELMVVIAFLGLILAIALPLFGVGGQNQVKGTERTEYNWRP
jgi:prepilin-type N-terminal cleavage/methylation domain-containing protein